jgi:hypothetical protein
MILLEWFKRRLTNGARRARNDAARAESGAGNQTARGANTSKGDFDEFDENVGLNEGDSAIDPFDPFPEPVRIEIADIIDLHSIAPRDVQRAVEAYLEEAHRAGFRSVRIIHGKGRGVQRETVRKILARTPFVLDWADAPPQAGGLGATIAHLAPVGDR